MQFKDYYETLGVEPSAGEAEIKTAYRRLARKYHPDVSKEAGAEEKFKAINEAYEALRDPQKRAAYDQLRARGYRPGDEVQPPPGGFGGGGFGGGVDFDEIFAGGGAGGGFSDFFESMFGRSAAVASASAARSRAATRAPSSRCRWRRSTTAAACASRSTTSTLDVRMPKGIRPGQVIRLAGQGAQGDLLLEIEYAAHPQFEVDGRNVIHVLPVAPWEAALGATVSVPTLGGAGGAEDSGQLRGRPQVAPARTRIAGRCVRQASRGRPAGRAGSARAARAQRCAAGSLRDACAKRSATTGVAS